MDEEIYVSCHAPSLSFLLFETARSVHDQKGLLIGQICSEVISRKTDENEINCEHKTAIYLEHCIPIEDQDIIGNAGIINKSKLQRYIDILQNKIVGWYSFRRNSRLVPSSLSEMLIHQSLLELLPQIKCQYFVACFMSSNVTANMSTHTFNHIFMTYDSSRGRFEPLRLKIYTLSDKSLNSNGYSMKNPFPTSTNFDKIINYMQKEETPVKSVLAIHERVSEVLKLIDRKLQNTESHRLQLEHEVETLKKRLQTVNNKEIVVDEPEKEELDAKTIVYDPDVKYNPNRKTNPLKLVVVMKPAVPAEKPEEKLNPEQWKNYSSEENNSSLPLTPSAGPKGEQRRNCSPSATVTSSSFTSKLPKNKTGLSSIPTKANNCVVNSCDLEEFYGENENSEKRASDSNNVQQPKPMEF